MVVEKGNLAGTNQTIAMFAIRALDLTAFVIRLCMRKMRSVLSERETLNKVHGGPLSHLEQCAGSFLV